MPITWLTRGRGAQERGLCAEYQRLGQRPYGDMYVSFGYR